QEFTDGNPYKAFICFSLMAITQLSGVGKETLRVAMQALNKNEPDKFRFITKSVDFRIHFDCQKLKEASGYYINANTMQLKGEKLDNLQLDGIRLRRAALDH